MPSKTEYLITRVDRNMNTTFELRAPKGVNITLLLERLMSRELTDDALIASCLRANSRRAYDPFQIVDLREEYRRDKAKAALHAAPNAPNPNAVYEQARRAPLPLGKPLIFAGVSYEFSVKEVEVSRARNSNKEGDKQ